MKSKPSSRNDGARAWYSHGVADHYRETGASYENPHADLVDQCVRDAVRELNFDLETVLDLAAGSGEASVPLISLGANISAIDPFTFDAYTKRTGRRCERISFEQIAAGALRSRSYSLVVCSFAMHLCEASLLPQLAIELAQASRNLLVITPHKRPTIRPDFGWTLLAERTIRRVRWRGYRSELFAK